jgi:hypothetical protein
VTGRVGPCCPHQLSAGLTRHPDSLVEAGSTLPYSLAMPEAARWKPEVAAPPPLPLGHVLHLLHKPPFLWTNVIQQALWNLHTTRAVLAATKLPMDHLWVNEPVMSSFISVQCSFFFFSFFLFHSFFLLSIILFVFEFSQSFIHSLFKSFMHFNCSYIYLFIHTFIHIFIYAFIIGSSDYLLSYMFFLYIH